MDSNQGDANASNDSNEAPQLLAVLKEMKSGLDVVRAKVQALTLKVKEGQFPTADGISYLETKHLLLLSYCQSIVYYLLRKAKGLSIESHPVVRSLVEIRLFLEKIRPIDKKLEYQIQKLTKAAMNLAPERPMSIGNDREEGKKDEEDALKFRPNPDMLVSKSVPAEKDGGGVYRPPKFAPTSMGEDKLSKQEKQAMRKDKELLRQARENTYLKELMGDMEDKPEEIREFYGADSREVARYKAKREARDKQEEELFTRAPISKKEKKLERHMLKSRNGLLGLTDGFDDEMRMLPLEGKEKDSEPTYSMTGSGGKRFKKRKRKH
ncbi:hypothetical protein J5N97_027299 [Dioscorea zingiberensis]|uniref:Neuroguidin n=1 Tax=Dioscorea zingiberensis TaxID=325984 RepID=A0A9D5C3S1_9LILI|nr:hypothetical protein J5N97_027299 [Dioscorea zingiberensis]